MNGYVATAAFWLLNALIGALVGLISFIVYMHIKLDDERKKEFERRLDELHQMIDKNTKP